MEFVWAVAVVAIVAGAVVGFVARGLWATQAIRAAQEKAARIVAEARTQQKELILEAKDEKLRLGREAEEEAAPKRAELAGLERRLLRATSSSTSAPTCSSSATGSSWTGSASSTGPARRPHGPRGAGRRPRAREQHDRRRGEGPCCSKRSARMPRATRSGSPGRSSARRATPAQEKAREVIVTAIQRVAADHTRRAHGHGRPSAVGRDEGADHRPRGPQHPGARAGDRAST